MNGDGIALGVVTFVIVVIAAAIRGDRRRARERFADDVIEDLRRRGNVGQLVLRESNGITWWEWESRR